MPKYKHYNYNQTVMVPISFDQQILSGTFEHSINYLVDHQLDLTIFHHRFKNDDTGRPAYDPAILLKIVLLAYSRGITGSRKIEALCRENVVFMAISADSRPHFTTIADFISSSGKAVKSNITDNDSAKMKTGHGVVQGYNGVAAVDGKHQVVVAAEAYGQGQEHGLLEPMLDRVRENLNQGTEQDVLTAAKILADSGYHNTKTLEHLEEQKIDAYIADNAFRSRDPRFQTASRHKANETPKPKSPKQRFTVEDFDTDTEEQTCVCPASKAMLHNVFKIHRYGWAA